MAAVKGHYASGKSSSIGKGGVTHSMGKNPPSHGGKVGNSAGLDSGTRRHGDANGCKPMKGC